MSFEQLVRPAQKTSILPTRRILSTREVVEVQPAGATWGKAGTLPTAIEVPPEEDPAGISFTVKKDKEHTLDYEGSKKQKVRVENPNDPGQFVVEERLVKAKFVDKKPDTVPVYRVNPDGSEASSDRTTVYSPGGSSIETVRSDTDTTYGVIDPRALVPLKVDSNKYVLIYPPAPNEIIISESGPN